MDKRTLCTLLAVVQLLAFCACAAQTDVQEDAYPTLPSLQTDKTPLQQLEAAFQSAATHARTVQYGTLQQTGDETAEDLHCQTVSDTQPFDRAALYANLADFPDNDSFLTDFCDLPLQVIPSNKGTFRYQVTDLCWEDAQQLLYAQPRDSVYTQALCTVAMDLDAQGRFTRLEIVFTVESAVTTLYLSIAFPDSP